MNYVVRRLDSLKQGEIYFATRLLETKSERSQLFHNYQQLRMFDCADPDAETDTSRYIDTSHPENLSDQDYGSFLFKRVGVGRIF